MVNVNDERLCEGRESFTSPATLNFFFYLVLLPVFLAVSWRVLAYLVSRPKSRMIVASIAYVLLAIGFQLFGFYFFVARDFMRVVVPIPVCATLEWFNWMFAGSAFIVFQQVFVQRLAAVFAQSQFEVKPWVIKLWGVFHVSAMVFATTMLILRATVTNCFSEYKLTGFLVDADVFPQKSYACDFHKKNEYTENSVLLVTAIIVLFGNGALTWMYTRRLYLVFSPVSASNSNPKLAAKNRRTMRKTTIVALASFTTDLIAFIASKWELMHVMYVDSLLNVFFLFCLFKAGRNWYDATLRHFEWIVNWIFADALRRGPLDVDSIHSLSGAQLSQPPATELGRVGSVDTFQSHTVSTHIRI